VAGDESWKEVEGEKIIERIIGF